jgi:hypothetical protein
LTNRELIRKKFRFENPNILDDDNNLNRMSTLSSNNSDNDDFVEEDILINSIMNLNKEGNKPGRNNRRGN